MLAPRKMLPENYDSLPIATKELLWFGTLLYYQRPDNFNRYDWTEELLNVSEKKIFEDENIILCVGYASEYTIDFKNGKVGFSGEFNDFFLNDDRWEELDLESKLGKEYKGISLVGYLRQREFPITAEFWNWNNGTRKFTEG